jgi:hypothetical protein
MFTSKHHPNGGAQAHCDNGQLERAIACYQAGHAESLGEVIRLVEPRTTTLIRFHKTHHYRTEDELLSDVNFKLLRAVRKFDPSKGSAFSFVSTVITSTLRTAVTNTRRHWLRYSELDSELANTLPARSDDWSVCDDLVHKVKSRARTTLTDETEISACRWLIESFCQDGFGSRRHASADACMTVFQVSHGRARELHDLSSLEIRRVLYDDLRAKTEIIPERLIGTRCAWMTRYKSLLSRTEFTKFYFLLKNLAPYLLLLVVDPAKKGTHRRDRAATITRKNLQLILYGDVDAIPLFSV